MEEEDWRAWQSFLVQWGLVFTLMLVALVLLPYILKSLGYAVRCHATTEPPPHHRARRGHAQLSLHVMHPQRGRSAACA